MCMCRSGATFVVLSKSKIQSKSNSQQKNHNGTKIAGCAQ